MGKAKAKRPRARPTLVTVDLGPDVQAMLDALVVWHIQHSNHVRGSAAMTRSYAVRKAIERSYDLLVLSERK